MSEKPTLQEIAAMPFPASIEAMRKYYQRDWAKPLPEGATEKRKFRVQVDYEASFTGTQSVEVEAWTEEEAEDIGAEKVCGAVERECDGDGAYADPTKVTVKPIEVQQ